MNAASSPPPQSLDYAATSGRLFTSRPLARRVATAHWLYRLAFNAQIEAERGFSRHRRRQILLGQEPPKRPSAYDQDAALASLRQDDAAGPAMREAALFPVTMLRAAVREAHEAVTSSLKRRAEGKPASLPRFRSADEAQTIKLPAFAVRRCDPGGAHPKMTVAVKGLGRLKMRLSRALPAGHAPVELRLTRHPDGRMEMQVVSRGPAPAQRFDPEAVGGLIHAAVRGLPEDAPNQAYVAAGLIVRGADVGLLAPIATSDGLASKQVRRERAEVAAAKEHLRQEARRTRRARRSKAAEHARKLAARAERKARNRRRTRALQDAAMLVRGNGPKRGNPHLRPHDGAAGREPAMLVATERRTVERGVVERSVGERKGEPAAWKRRRARNTARRIAETGMSLRIRRAAQLCVRQGSLPVEVEPRGTTRECSACGADVPKELGERIHRCPACGHVADRDANAAVNALGRALRLFRTSADPGGAIAAAKAAAVKAEARRRRRLDARSQGGRTRGETLKARRQDNGGVVAPGLKHQGGMPCISN